MDQNSQSFYFSRKLGLIVGTMVRSFIIGTVFVYLIGLFGPMFGLIPTTNPVPAAKPAANPPQSPPDVNFPPGL